MGRKTRQPDRRKERGGRAGFTLIELLVVIAIMAVLIGLVVGIGAWITKDSKTKQTIIAQRVLLEAINAFYNSTDPPAYPADGGAGPNSGKTLLNALVANPDATKVLQGLSSSLWKAGDVAFKDGFGNNMRYDADGGMGGTPVVISAGPDGKFGDESGLTPQQKQEAQQDNIRSDMQ